MTEERSDPAVLALRERACDRAVWARTRDLLFERAGSFREFAMHGFMRDLFTALAVGRTLPATRTQISPRTYNQGEDDVYITPEGDGLLVAEHCFGALPHDGVDVVYHLLVRDEIAVVCDHGMDYTQSILTLELSANADAIDPATDAILACAANAGLVLHRRDDTPTRSPRRHP